MIEPTLSKSLANHFCNVSNYSLHIATLQHANSPGLLQVLFGMARPGLASPRRRLFNAMHWWVGRLCLAIGVAEMYYGLVLAEAGWGYYAGTTLCLAAAASLMVSPAGRGTLPPSQS